MKYGLLDGRGCENNGIGFVEISEIFVAQDTVFSGTETVDRV